MLKTISPAAMLDSPPLTDECFSAPRNAAVALTGGGGRCFESDPMQTVHRTRAGPGGLEGVCV